MRQLWITGPGAAEIRDVATPVPGPDEVVVDTEAAGICGSDLHTLRRGHPWLPYPIAPGHEAAGVVSAVGPRGSLNAATPLAVGDRVYLRPAIACGRCDRCRRGRPNLCERLVGVGSHTPGAFADAFAVPWSAVARVPEGILPSEAALIEPMATAVHAVATSTGDVHRVHRSELSDPAVLAGADVLVVGGGSIGLCVLLAALAAGADRVVVSDPVPAKRALAESLGASATVDPGELAAAGGAVPDAVGNRPEVVFDCVSSAATVQLGLQLVPPGGSVVLVGVGAGPVPVSIEAVQDGERRLVGSTMYRPSDFDVAAGLVAAGLPVGRLVTATRPLSEAPAALREAATGAQVKIQLVPDELLQAGRTA